MNICMMTNTYLPHVGGVARSVHTFTQELRRQGHRVLVIAPTFPESSGNQPANESGVVRLPAIQRFNGSDFSVRVPLPGKFNTTLSAFQPDLVHSHHPFLLGDTALRFAAKQKAPVVFTHHTRYEEYTHYVPFNSPKLKQFVIELSTHYANLCDAVIAPSDSIARLIQQRGVNVEIDVIPTGIDVQAFAQGNGKAFRQAHHIPPGAFVVGHVGRLAPEKNLRYLTRAVRRFLNRLPDAFFLVIGEGPSRSEIRRLFEEENLENRLLLPGKKEGSELADAYRAMNGFAFSSFSETQGVVLTEAMAAGLPVVALDASGVREVVRHHQNGFLLPADSPETDFADCLEQLARHPDTWQEMSAAATQTARQFSREQSAEKLIRLYDRVIRQTRRQRADDSSDPLAGLRHRLEIEWLLITQKAESAIHAISSEHSSPSNQA